MLMEMDVREALIDFIPFWNRKDLTPPEIVSCMIVSNSPDADAAALSTKFKEILEELKDKRLLHFESAVLSRLAYRMHNTFRGDKGFKTIKKVNQCLRNYLLLDLESTISTVEKSIYGKNGPSRQLLEWALVRIMSFSALFNRVNGLCLTAGEFFRDRLATGNSWPTAFVAMASLGRIWVYSKYLTRKSCEWYLELEGFLSKLTSHEKWLPDNFRLPNNLRDFLGNPEYLKDEKVPSVFDSNSQSTGPKTYVPPAYAAPGSCMNFLEDLGEPVVEEEEVNHKKEIMKLSCPQDFLTFLKKENARRSTERENALTRNVNDLEWNKFSGYIIRTVRKSRNIKDKLLMKANVENLKDDLRRYLPHSR